MDEILKKYTLLNNRNVSRETLLEFDQFIHMIQKKNKEINIISKKTAINELIRDRHIVDSAQIIEFIDLKSNIVTDIGTGGGMPGIIISIMLKKLKNSVKVHLHEKSQHKSFFLRKVCNVSRIVPSPPKAIITSALSGLTNSYFSFN